jgi:hypothetical protein
MYRHKIETCDRALQEFDEIIILDWDTLTVNPLPDDFWDSFTGGMPIRTALRSLSVGYTRRFLSIRQAHWRTEGKNEIVWAGCTYMRGREVSLGIIETWEKLGRPWSDEVAIAAYLDGLSGGWKGTDYHWEHFEMMHFSQPGDKAFPDEMLATKRLYFQHFSYDETRTILANTEKGVLLPWQKGA